LEDTNLPLASGVTDRYGVFARTMLEALMLGYAYLWGRAVQSDCA
jgi:hypothetical protein